MRSLSALLIAALLPACQLTTPSVQSPVALSSLLHDEQFVPPAQRYTAQTIFMPSTQMRNYLEHKIESGNTTTAEQYHALIEALSSPSALGLRYDSLLTLTAADSFEQRSGNCLTLAVLAYTLADTLGLYVHFNEPKLPLLWDRQQGYYFLTNHVNVTIQARDHNQPDGGITTLSAHVDFSGNPAVMRLPHRKVSKAEMVAMFNNNLAAEALTRGELNQAYYYAADALRSDARFVPAYATLASAYRRAGFPQQAEITLRAGLSLEPENYALLSNLVLLLEPSPPPDYDLLVQRLAQQQQKIRNPYRWADKAEQAYQEGDYRTSLMLYRRALEHGDYIHEFYFGIAKNLLALDQPEQAQRFLRQAHDLSPTLTQQARYHRKLEMLARLNPL